MSRDVSIKRNGSWLRARVRVNIDGGLGLIDSFALRDLSNRTQTFLHTGDSVFPVHLGPAYITKDNKLGIGATYRVGQGAEVEIVTRTGPRSRLRIRDVCNYLSSYGESRPSVSYLSSRMMMI